MMRWLSIETCYYFLFSWTHNERVRVVPTFVLLRSSLTKIGFFA